MNVPIGQSMPSGKPQPTDREIYAVAKLHRFMILLGTSQAILLVSYLVVFKLLLKPAPWADRLGFQLVLGVGLALCLCGAAASLRIGRLTRADHAVLKAIVCGVPFLGAALFFIVDGEIREYLSGHGLKVGLMGVSSDDAEKLVA